MESRRASGQSCASAPKNYRWAVLTAAFLFSLNFLVDVDAVWLNAVELQQCSGAYRITPVDVNSRPSSCLTNFLLTGSYQLQQHVHFVASTSYLHGEQMANVNIEVPFVHRVFMTCFTQFVKSVYFATTKEKKCARQWIVCSIMLPLVLVFI